MKIGMPLSYAGGFRETADRLSEFEDVGLDLVMLPEAYSYDSVSQLGYLAARTERVELSASILNVYSRSPALIAMTAAGLDHVSDGRFVLGLGASGPQVVEGFHGVPYKQPLGRTREVVEICRRVWRREALDFHGDHFDVPLRTEDGGSGLGKPLKLINHPVRDRIPIVLAALGPKNVALAAEVAEGWEPIFYHPEGAAEAFGEALAEGNARRPADMDPLQVVADTMVCVSEDADEIAAAEERARGHIALYVGGMGARGKNFYHDLATRFGFGEEADTVQDLFLGGRKAEAVAAVPDALLHGVMLIGSRSHVAERVAAFAASGVHALNATPLSRTHEGRVADVAALKEVSA